MIISRFTVVRVALRCAATTVLVSWAVSSAAQTVAIVTDGPLEGPARHGLASLEEALRTKGVTVVQGVDSLAPGAVVVLAGVRSTNGAATAALRALRAPLPDGAEALTIRRGGTYARKPALIVVGSDSTGLMYALLDVADRVGWSARPAEPFAAVHDVSEAPFLATRAVSMYTMNRAYFESRLYDERFWTRYFDTLAADRFNQFVISAGYENSGFLGPIYPYLHDVPGFPEVKMVELTAGQQARNLAAFKTMIRLAHERGIKVILGGWDHIDRAVVQDLFQSRSSAQLNAADQEIQRARLAMQQIPGLIPKVTGLTSDNLLAYTKAALVRLCEVLPEFDGFQIRMHNEAGLKADVMAKFWPEIFSVLRGLKKSVDLRAKGVDPTIFQNAVDQGLKPTVNTKFWMEQVGLPFHPTHINKQNQQDQRHGYADLLKFPQTYKMTWQLWTGGTNRLLLWGDPEYVRRFSASARLYDSDSMEVNETGATKMHGEAHDVAPIPIFTPPYRTYDYEFERYWHFYRTWGRLTYNPQTAPEVWEHEFVRRFGAQSGPHVMRGLHLASQVLPRVVAASYLYVHFPTTNGWPEMQRQGSLPVYAAQEEGSDIQQFMSVKDAARSILEGTDTAMRRPEETSRWFARTSEGILRELAQAEKTAGPRASKEFQATAADLQILAGIARYHSSRLLAGVSYNLYKAAGDLKSFDDAIAHERQAIQAWSDMVAAAGDIYTPKQTFGPHVKKFPYHWSEELQLLERDFEQLLVERKSATVRADAQAVRIPTRDANAKPPLATLPPVAPAQTGAPLVVTANVTAPAGVKWVRLRYRHVNQREDYETADMRVDPKSGLYSGVIPATFIDPKWDLMYFVEVVDRNGSGRMYPDLDVETPYVIVPVKR